MPYLIPLITPFPISTYALTHFPSLTCFYLKHDSKPQFVPTNSCAWKIISMTLHEPCLVLRYDELPHDIQNAKDIDFDKVLPRAEKEQTMEKIRRTVKAIYRENVGKRAANKKGDSTLRIVAWEVAGSVVDALESADYKELPRA